MFADLTGRTSARPMSAKSPVYSWRLEAATLDLDAPFRPPAAPGEADLIAQYVRVLGDRTRLRIVELVSERECPIGELVRLLDEPQPEVSNHLACLLQSRDDGEST
jgi:hypothetical protein